MLSIAQWKCHASATETSFKDAHAHLERFHAIEAAANWIASFSKARDPIVNQPSIRRAKTFFVLGPLQGRIGLQSLPLIGLSVVRPFSAFQNPNRRHDISHDANDAFRAHKMQAPMPRNFAILPAA